MEEIKKYMDKVNKNSQYHFLEQHNSVSFKKTKRNTKRIPEIEFILRNNNCEVEEMNIEGIDFIVITWDD